MNLRCYVGANFIPQHLPEVGLYVPRVVLVDERADGVHITYNTVFLIPKQIISINFE